MEECGCDRPKINPIAMPEAPTCEPVLFHKVEIPAAMGDETEVPATAGKYKNVLLEYLYNNHLYFYSSDGIPTYIRSTGTFESLSDRPSYGGQVMTSATDIPTVSNGQFTISQNGTQLATFSANQSTNSAIDITVPTKTSDLTNDSDFVADANYVHTDNNYATTEKNKLSGLMEINYIGTNLSYDSDTKTLSANAQSATLYNTTGSHTDGAMTQKAVTDALAGTATTAQIAAVQAQIPTATSTLTNDSNFVADANYVHTDNNYTDEDEAKLASTATITMTTTDPGEGATLAANNFIAVYEA